MTDADGFALRTTANTTLKAQWLGLMGMLGVSTDEAVGLALPSPAARGLFGETPASSAAQRYLTDSSAWINEAARTLQSGGLSDGEISQLGYTFDVIQSRRIILMNARIKELSPVVEGVKAGAEELVNTGKSWIEILVIVGIVAAVAYVLLLVKK